jgi:hypothetical protein
VTEVNVTVLAESAGILTRELTLLQGVFQVFETTFKAGPADLEYVLVIDSCVF